MKLFTLFRTPSIRRSISTAFVLITVVVVAMVIVSYFQLRQVRPFSDLIVHNSSDLVDIQRLASATSALDADLERYLVIRGAEYRDNVQKDLQEMTDSLALLQADPIAGTETDLSELQATITTLQEKITPLLDAQSTTSSSADLNRLIVTIYNNIDQVKLLQENLSAKTLTSLQNTAQIQGSIASNVLTQSVILGVIVSLIALITTIATDRRLRRISSLTDTAVAISGGDISRVAPVESKDEIGKLAAAFNAMTSQLRELIGSLEERVAERTKALTTSAEVSRRLSRATDLNELASDIVNQIRDSFGYYHVQTYQVDEESGDLILSLGTGEAGEKMVAKGHRVPRGVGVVGRAAERGEPVLVSDTSQDPDWLPNPLLPDTKSEVAIPIMFETGVGGVFDVQHNVVNGLGQEDVDALLGVANQIAIASLNIISSQTVAKRAAELQTVAKVSTAAATLQDVDEMLTTVVHLTQREFDLYHAHVFVLNEETQELEIMACGWQAGDEHEGTHGTTVISLEQEQSLVARAARTRQPVIVNDVRNEPGWLPNPQLPETRAEMAVPLVVGDQVLGVMDVQASREGAFSDEDAAIHMTLASQVATALQNARSFVDAQKQAEREATLNIIAQKIQSTGTIEEAMQIAARELGHALGKRQTFVALDPKVLSEGSRAEVTTEAAE